MGLWGYFAGKFLLRPLITSSFRIGRRERLKLTEGAFGRSLGRVQKERAEAVDWSITWLKELSEEVESEGRYTYLLAES